MRVTSSQTKLGLLIGMVSLFSFVYFYEGGGWNQNSRFDLLRAIVEQHSLQIDAYHDNTGDKAHFRGHYYSDKAPGQVFLAVPVALAARAAMRIFGVDPSSPQGELATSYLANAGAVALPVALSVVCLFFLGLRLTGSPASAAMAALSMAVGTPIWAYASLFWAHALVGAFLVFGLMGALRLGEAANASREFLWALVVGLTAGWTTVTEYPAAPASAVLGLFALQRVWPRGARARWRTVAGVGIGAAVCLAILLWYLHAAFGSFRPSYSYYDPNSFSFMQQRGYLGLTYPHIDVLLKLLFGCRRGLFFAAPVTAAGAVGLYFFARNRETRAPAIAASIIVVYYFLFNASFYWWTAGLTFGPRYAGAAIPLLCLGIAAVWKRASQPYRALLAVLAICSVLICLMVVSTTSQLSVQDKCPLIRLTWPAFWHGQMAMNRESMLTVREAGSSGAYGAFNFGQLVGLHGLASLIPLLVVWAVAGFALVRSGTLEHRH